jgi:hypothetical protein
LINGISFIAIQVPRFLKGKRLRDTYIWKQLADNSDLPPDYLDQEIDNDYIVYWKTNAKDSIGNNIVNISSYNTGAKTDAVRECMKLGFNTSNIVYEAILWELIKSHDDLWEDYVNYLWCQADKDEDWHEEKIKHLDDIEWVFWINFNNYASNGYVVRDYWVYQNKNWNINGFLRGNDAHGGAVRGAVSLALCCPSGASRGDLSFRPSV